MARTGRSGYGARSRARRVLIVESDPSIARMLHLCLGTAGFEVAGADTGAAALQALDEGSPDAVVVDPGLPDGLGGAVLRRLTEDTSPGPAWVVMSALTGEETAGRYGGFRAPFLAKPFDPWTLVQVLRQLTAIPANSNREELPR
jgi:two-component system KDP operon response regulator KdpE